MLLGPQEEDRRQDEDAHGKGWGEDSFHGRLAAARAGPVILPRWRQPKRYKEQAAKHQETPFSSGQEQKPLANPPSKPTGTGWPQFLA